MGFEKYVSGGAPAWIFADTDSIDFSMCNPPFYESKAEMLASAMTKQRPAFSACTGSETEMVTKGGEVAFVSKMIDESLVLRDRVQWYTSMLGKFSSVAIIIEKLRANQIGNYAATEFIQGNKTRRWGIAWSFDDMRPNSSVARGLHSIPKSLLPFPPEYVIQVSPLVLCLSTLDPFQVGSAKCGEIGSHVDEALSQLPLKWMWKPTISTGVGFTDRVVWSRAARRHTSKNQSIDEEDIALGFKIHVGAAEADGVEVVIRWLKGYESVIFESFCGMLKRKLEEANKP
jgi:23S rRNA (adenine1618-N6)-methyltransferase